MKQLSILILCLTFTGHVLAATPTATPSGGTLTPTDKMDDLKERLATKVAELRQTQRKGIFGTVKDVSISTFTVTTAINDLKIELTDDIKIFQMIRGKRTQLTTEDLAKDDLVAVLGEFDTGLDLLRAKIIIIQSEPLQRVSGTIQEIDEKAFTISLTTTTGQEYVIDVEKTTNALAFDTQKGLIKGGFSKLEVGRTIHVVGTLDAKQDNRISAARIIDLGNLTGATPTPTATRTPTPTATTSGTLRSSPRATATPRISPTPIP